MAGISWKKRFAEFYKEMAEFSLDGDNGIDDTLDKYQDWYYTAADIPKASLHCSACGSSDTDHLAEVLAKKRCVLSAPDAEVTV